MNIQGDLTVIRDRTIEDSYDEIMWSADQDVVRYDVSAGITLNMIVLAIDSICGVHIGVCTIYNKTATNVQIGVRIGDKSLWNRGYCTDATKLLVKYIFNNFSVNRVWLKVLPENFGAIRCYEKCGFMYTGQLRLNGYTFNVMEITRNEVIEHGQWSDVCESTLGCS